MGNASKSNRFPETDVFITICILYLLGGAEFQRLRFRVRPLNYCVKLQRNGFDFIFLDRIYRIDGIFSPSARSPFGRRPFYPDDPVDPVQFSFKDENPFLFLPYFDLRFFTFLFWSDWPFFWPEAALVWNYIKSDTVLRIISPQRSLSTQRLFNFFFSAFSAISAVNSYVSFSIRPAARGQRRRSYETFI